MKTLNLIPMSIRKVLSALRKYRFDIWIPGLCQQHLKNFLSLSNSKSGGPCDVIFCFVDHFEPGTGGVDEIRNLNRFNDWMSGYPRLAEHFVDSDGCKPQHTFFFPPHYFREDYMRRLSEISYKGYGEVEMHLHHRGDNSETLRAKIEDVLDLYSQYGVFATEGDPVRRAYGFIHGDWALDNSIPKYCGVNNELSILLDTGCYADFTFPSLGVAQPRMVNRIYRAKGNPEGPKSYDRGIPIKAGSGAKRTDLMLVTGPIGLRPRSRFPWLAVEDAEVTGEAPGTRDRVRKWVRTNIHVDGKPDWIFVKVHTHGAVEKNRDALLGEGARGMLTALCEQFNDGKFFRLHFVTAREMFNIARSAEEGLSGDPNLYRDLEIPRYLSRSIRSNRPYECKRFKDGVFDFSWKQANMNTHMEIKRGPVRFLAGNMVRAEMSEMTLKLLGPGPFRVGTISAVLKENGQQLKPTYQKMWGNELIDIHENLRSGINKRMEIMIHSLR